MQNQKANNIILSQKYTYFRDKDSVLIPNTIQFHIKCIQNQTLQN